MSPLEPVTPLHQAFVHDVLFQNSITPMVVVDKERTIVKVNQAFLKLFEYQEYHIVGSKTSVIAPSREKWEEYSIYFRDAYTNDEVEPFEVEYRKATGENFWVKLSGRTITLGDEKFIIWSLVDISLEIEYRNELTKKTKKLEIIFNNAQIGIVSIKQGFASRCNPSFLKMFGLELEDVLYAPCERVCQIVGIRKGDVFVEKDIKKPDGSAISVEITVKRIDKDLSLLFVKDITRHIKEKRHLEYISKIDELTKLYNRRAFNEIIESSLKYAQEATFAILDIDDFKYINDTYGHDIGDEVLQELGTLLKDSIKGSGFIARLGGEEFALFMEKDLKEGLRYLENLRFLISQKEFTSKSIHISCSIGASSKSMAKDYKEIYKRADKALYRSKNNGKNKISIS